jgi:hypothetical protein
MEDIEVFTNVDGYDFRGGHDIEAGDTVGTGP